MTATTGQDLALVGAVAHALTAEEPPEDALRRVADLLRSGLRVQGVALWHRAPSATHFIAATAPREAWRSVTSLEELPQAGPEALRLPLMHGGGRLGVMELLLAAGAPSPDRSLLVVLADVIAPHLDAMALSEDLATEVASRMREIDEQRRFTALVIDSLPVGLYVIDRDYRIQVWNRKRETGTQGIRREDAVGRVVFDVLNRQPAGRLREEFDRVFGTGELVQYEIEVARVGDRPRQYRLSKIPMRIDGDAVTHIITIGEDVTDARAALQRTLQSQKLVAIGQLAAGVMHEINNPLATIGACVAAMEGRLREIPGAVPTVAEYLEIIDSEVHRCTKIADGLLDLARPSASGNDFVEADLSDLVQQTFFLLKHNQRFKHVDVVRDLAQNLPRVRVNPGQLVQVFMALMLNAQDAIEEAGRTGSEARLTLRTRPHPTRPDDLAAEIEDTGTGITPRDMTRIFEPFYTTKAHGKGTGLGLAIAHGIVEKHGGHLEVESEPGAGALFRVVLPIHREPAA